MDDVPVPYSHEAERDLLGAVLLGGGDELKKVLHLVTADDFHMKIHAVIFRAMVALYEHQTEPDYIGVTDFLRMKGYLEDVGGAEYLQTLYSNTHSTTRTVSYAKIVAERATLRRIIQACSDVIQAAGKEPDLSKLLMLAEDKIKGVTRQAAKAESKLKTVDADDWRKIARDTEPNPGQVRGISSGYKCIDELTEGFSGGDMYILTGHTKHGKSQLALNWAVNVAKQGKTILFINTEMTKLQMGRRLNSILSDRSLPGKILLNDRSDLEARDVVAIMEQAKENGCDMVVVDHLHYFARSEDNATGQISKYTKEFKDAAVNLDLPLLMLCHIDQSKPETMIPTIKMLKNSSSIAQDADMVLTVFRNEDKQPGIMEVVRLIGRSTSGGKKFTQLYTEGFKLTEQKPENFADIYARQLGEKDEIDLSIPGWG